MNKWNQIKAAKRFVYANQQENEDVVNYDLTEKYFIFTCFVLNRSCYTLVFLYHNLCDRSFEHVKHHNAGI